MNELAALLRSAPEKLKGKHATAGFDGFQDRILRPIRKIEGETLEYFGTISDFGAFLQQKKGKSCSIELDIQTNKIGGNCPIFSAALGAAGVRTDCVGMFSGGDFAAMPSACTLHSYAKVATADCLEFLDGKVLLAARCTMAEDPYEAVLAAVPELPALYEHADLAAFLNWSELDYASALWEGIERHIFAALKPDFTKYAFFDLCDIARKSHGDILSMLTLLGRFSLVRHTVLSLNENECLLLGSIVGGVTLAEIARALQTRFGIREVLVHTLKTSYALAGDVWHSRPTIFCEKPVLSTGAGDNFNAGYAFGLLLTDEPQTRLALANLFSSRYITSGRNFDLIGLADYAESIS